MAHSKPLTFSLHWNQEGWENPNTYISACQRVFRTLERARNLRVQISEPLRKLNNGVYNDQTCQVLCTVHTSPFSDLEAYDVIRRHWCLTGKMPAFQGRLQWLVPDRNRGFRRGGTLYESIQLSSMSFGTFVGFGIFAESHKIDTITTFPGYTLTCTFKHGERMLQVLLELRHKCDRPTTLYRLTVPYGSILRPLPDVFLHLQTFPLLCKKVEPLRTWRVQPTNPEHFFFDRVLELGCSCVSLFESQDLGGNSVMKLSFRHDQVERKVVDRLSRRCKRGTTFAYAPMQTREVGSQLKQARHWFNQGNDAVAQMVLLQQQAFHNFVNNLVDFARVNEGALEQALFCIRSAIEARSIVNVHVTLPELFRKFCLAYFPPKVPRGSCLVRRVFVTPSCVFFLPPNVHSENRVLRCFDAEYALRVSFRDDNLQHLSHSLMFHRQKEEMVDTIVAKFLRTGIEVGGRQFKFLASSCSQLRDHGVWLYAMDRRGFTAESIRRWMGDFSAIPNVAKKMARMGQCFSSTEESVKVPLRGGNMEEVPDVVGGVHPVSGKEFTFSDGIGMISTSLMQKVCKKLDLAEVPSAIQIRYAGYKGMLCVNPELRGDKLVLRDSMRKFSCSNSDSLEVIKVSAPRTVYLNRFLITILEQLGVPSRVFLCLQQKMMLTFADALVCESTALRVLCTYVGGTLPFLRLQQNGFCLTRDPFVRLLLYTVYRSTMDGLRTKARIAVPQNKGRNMLGVFDETATLEYGEVFVQYTHLGLHAERNRQYRFGPRDPRTVLVTKCPCLHPGDVRKFKAVDVPALHHVKDCIVFPAKGSRPHPNEMAGSDLDGDEYIVIWEPDLFFPGSNKTPMTFSDSSSAGSADENLEEGMIKFICNYIINDNVGIMSNAHLAWSDQLEDGIFSPLCLGIAKKISTCVDFAKTGLASCLDRHEKPLLYPDFMEKGGSKDTYRSKRVLGHLYRLHRSLQAVINTDFMSRTGQLAEGDSHCTLFEYPGWKDHQEVAEKALAAYTVQMSRILHQYGVGSEGEVVSGIIINVSEYNKSNEDKNSVKALVAKQYANLVKSTRDTFFSDVTATCNSNGASTDIAKKMVLLQMASAWYMVTYAGAWHEQNCQSFPWSVADVLLLILVEVNAAEPKPKRKPKNLLIAKLNEVLADALSTKSSQDVALDVVLRWATKEELLNQTRQTGPRICRRCLVTVYGRFLGSVNDSGRRVFEEIQHSASDMYFEGKQETAGGYVVGFLRYVNRPGFRSMVEQNEEGVARLFKDWSGVLEVSIRKQVNFSGRYLHILVSAVGRDWQLWYLEELLLQPWIGEAVEKGDLEPFLSA
ncbi:hypothetical protein HPB47_002632 [Ixodes persulcatus]|uniref:Uncharacterized protein n=1 Tax=Ixodes persulcatus TaxID=34615 RepID=A0AC60PKQ9_IXOPE|nr:hypothetical protein HPB47_002632 [Ixodes persulcatus]